MAIINVVDQRRACGWRAPGGLYLRCDGPPSGCGRLPVPLETCPTCGAGIKPTRGMAWINPQRIITKPCTGPDGRERKSCGGCMLDPVFIPKRAGLLWIGARYYPTPQDFIREAVNQGVSRRITAIPKEFKVNHTLIFLAMRGAHREFVGGVAQTVGWVEPQLVKVTGMMFAVFKPSRIEYIVRGTETPDEIASLEKRGITCVRVTRATECQTVIGE